MLLDKWKNIILLVPCKEELFAFREVLYTNLTLLFSDNTTKCNKYGSSNILSDIDITITGTNFSANKTHLYTIRNHITKKFITNKDVIRDSKVVNKVDINSKYKFKSLYHFYRFFDLNLYISDFGFKKYNKPDNMLSSYYLSNQYNKNEEKNQYKYAFMYLCQICDNSNNVTYNNLIDTLEKETQLEFNTNTNTIIDLISKISLYEDNAYHTQGAFFHVVLMMQRRICFEDINDYLEIYINMLKASYIENLVFSSYYYTINDTFKKYIMRVNDASIRLVNLGISETEKEIETNTSTPDFKEVNITIDINDLEVLIKVYKEYYS